ncbi:FkbM family methyltransferase [Methylobacterium hispanicum]|uniref:FkbM family methyltransferase n=1 Tax=Methylobacterium hispanicum TaxID=270350 RepID=UPI002F2CE115
MKGTKNPRDSLIEAVALLRRREKQAALPFAESALADPTLQFAPMVYGYAQALARGDETAEFALRGQEFKFSLGSANIGLEMFHANGKKLFEEAELTAVERLLPRRSVIVDVRANVGNHAIFFAKMLAPKILIPVEPASDTVEALRKNLALNAISVDERGLGMAAGSRAGWSMIERGALQDLVEARTGSVTDHPGPGAVRCVPLDDLVPERVDLLKIDVEGGETDVIRGANRILREDKPLVILEAHDSKRSGLLAQMAAFGYEPLMAFGGIGYQNILMRIR